MILIIIKCCQLLLRISPRIINSLRSYIKHSKECFLLFRNTSKLVKKTRLRLVFLTYFSVFENLRKHSSPCLIYYLNNGVTLAHFQSSGNIPETKDLLKRSHSETEIRLAHSRIILVEILSRPVALHLHNLFRCKKTILQLAYY